MVLVSLRLYALWPLYLRACFGRRMRACCTPAYCYFNSRLLSAFHSSDILVPVTIHIVSVCICLVLDTYPLLLSSYTAPSDHRGPQMLASRFLPTLAIVLPLSPSGMHHIVSIRVILDISFHMLTGTSVSIPARLLRVNRHTHGVIADLLNSYSSRRTMQVVASTLQSILAGLLRIRSRMHGVIPVPFAVLLTILDLLFAARSFEDLLPARSIVISVVSVVSVVSVLRLGFGPLARSTCSGRVLLQFVRCAPLELGASCGCGLDGSNPAFPSLIKFVLVII